MGVLLKGRPEDPSWRFLGPHGTGFAKIWFMGLILYAPYKPSCFQKMR